MSTRVSPFILAGTAALMTALFVGLAGGGKSCVAAQDSSPAPSANFQGNTTAINAIPGDLLVMLRQNNCSLNEYSASYTFAIPTFDYTEATATTNYDQTLHKAAGLTTKGAILLLVAATRPLV